VITQHYNLFPVSGPKLTIFQSFIAAKSFEDLPKLNQQNRSFGTLHIIIWIPPLCLQNLHIQKHFG